jgi:hypothetical protein
MHATGEASHSVHAEVKLVEPECRPQLDLPPSLLLLTAHAGVGRRGQIKRSSCVHSCHLQPTSIHGAELLELWPKGLRTVLQ